MSTENPRGWLFGPASDLLWGSGLGYVAVFGLLVVASPQMTSAFPPWLLLFLVVLLSIPHYGATILRVFERQEDRRSYALLARYSTLLVGLFLLWGARDLWVGSILFTAYLTWSPWHYTGQNYGITLMFLGRRGADLELRTRLCLKVSYLTSYVVIFFFIHSGYTFYPYTGDHVQFLSLNVPALAADLVLFVALLLYGASTAALVAGLVRKGVRRVFPALALLLTHAIWFVVPAAVKNWLPYANVPILTSSFDAYAFTWIALGHGVQYLWITLYFARKSGRATSSAGFYARALMAGSAIWAIPMLLFAPGLLGKLPYDVGLASVTAAVVNLHHFVLDGAIWKLKDSRIAQVLVKRTAETVSAGPPSLPSRIPSPWRWAMATAGVFSFTVLAFTTFEEEFGMSRGLTSRNLARAETASVRLASLGRDSPYARLRLGHLASQERNPERALHHFEAGVALYPTTAGWIRLGEALSAEGETRRAMNAFESALVLDPGDETAKMHVGIACFDLGEIARAREILAASDSRRQTFSSERLRKRLSALLKS
jgi:tetratricopeptide (TPR) repeat protein